MHAPQSNISEECSSDTIASRGTAVLSHNRPHFWNNCYHAVPENYQFPSTSVKDLWDLWLYGNVTSNIAPFRFIDPKLDLAKTWRVRHSRAKHVMMLLFSKCSCSVSEIVAKTRGETDLLFEEALAAILGTNNAGEESNAMAVDAGRVFQLSYATVYNKIREKK